MAAGQPERSFPLTTPAQWIVDRPVHPQDLTSEGTGSSSVHWLLFDTQVRVGVDGEERYNRYAIKVLDESGVDIAGDIRVDFDPEYQSLRIHEIGVYRDGEWHNRYYEERVQLMQRETELDAKLYDGRLTFNLVLEDLRVGDTVSYAYTIEGANPVFDGVYSDAFYTEWSVPVEQLHVRLVWPEERPLQIRTFGGAPQPTERRADGVIEYLWALESIPARLDDGETPGWYDPYAWVQLSEWGSWKAVAEWAVPMYRADPGALQADAEELAASSEGAAEQLVAALRFAQDEIRYVGFEMGRGSHEPRHPGLTLRQRFGDCKDKSLLLVSLLDALGISSSAALVHSYRDKGTDDWLPTPLAFDHVIVVAELDGNKVWMDPTLTFQRGDLENLHQPDYGRALIIAPQSSGLVTPSPERSGGATHSVKQTIDLSAGVDREATFLVETSYSGSQADRLRAWRAHQSEEEVDKSYLNYYANSYPGITRVGSVKFDDDQRRNEIVVHEEYRIDGLWQRADDGERLIADIVPQDTIDLISEPHTSIRTMPLAITHPINHFQEIDVQLPEAWDLEPFAEEFENDAVRMQLSARARGKRLRLAYSYNTKADYLPAAKVPSYLEDLDDFYSLLGYRLTPPGPLSLNWPIATIAVFAFLAGAYVAWRIYLFEPSGEPPPVAESDRLVGLGGWLALLGLGVIITPLRVLVESFQTYAAIDPITWSSLTSPASADYHPLWAPLIIFEVVGNSVIFAVSIAMVALFLTRRFSFPTVFRTYLVAHVAFLLIDAALASSIPEAAIATEDYTQLGRDTAAGLGWFLYLGASKRVAATFTRRRVPSAETYAPDSSPALPEA